MTEHFKDIPAPITATGPTSADQVCNGIRIPAQQQILLYSGGQWEVFIHEWAHFCLKDKYVQVQQFSGAGDRGIDIAGFESEKKLGGVWDNYQCKHYDHALYPGDAWPEIGKILWYSFNHEYLPPRRYFFVAPFGVGTTLGSYLANASRLKKALIENWDKKIASSITDTQKVALNGEFLAYVECFDFSIFDTKTALQVIDDHQKCPYHSVRFGTGLPSRPASEKPPSEPVAIESRYIAQLLMAYGDHLKSAVPNPKILKHWPKLEEHFGRQREAFYHAESLRVFARDTVPAGTFESLQEDIYAGVIDVHDDDHTDGYRRILSVTKAARDLHLTGNALIMRSRPIDRDGICHHLANDDRLKWTKP